MGRTPAAGTHVGRRGKILGGLGLFSAMALLACGPSSHDRPPEHPTPPMTPEAQFQEVQQKYPAVAEYVRDASVLGNTVAQMIDKQLITLDIMVANVPAPELEVVRRCPRSPRGVAAPCTRVVCRMVETPCDFDCSPLDEPCLLREALCAPQRSVTCQPI